MPNKPMPFAPPNFDALLAPIASLLHSDNPLRPWAVTLAVCALACLPRGSRRLGGALFFSVLVACGVWLFVQHAFRDFTPAGP